MENDKNNGKPKFSKDSKKNNGKKSRNPVGNPTVFFIPNVYGQVVRIRIRIIRRKNDGYNPNPFHRFPNSNDKVPFFVVKRWTLQTAINLVEDLINYETYKQCSYTVEDVDREKTALSLLNYTFEDTDGMYEAYKELKIAVNGRGRIDKYKFPADEVKESTINFYDLNGNYIMWVENGKDHLIFPIDNTYTVIDKEVLKKFANWLNRYRDSHSYHNRITMHQDAAIQYINDAAFHNCSFVFE